MSSQTGQRCQRWAIVGGSVCATHGGRAPQVKAKAAQRIAEQKVWALLEQFGEPVEHDPLQALLDALGRASGAVVWIGQELARQQELAEQVGRPGSAALITTGKYRQEVSVLAKLYGEWTDRQARYAKAALDGGLDERVVRFTEAQGKMMADVVEAVLLSDELRLSESQIETGRQVAATVLRALPE